MEIPIPQTTTKTTTCSAKLMEIPQWDTKCSSKAWQGKDVIMRSSKVTHPVKTWWVRGYSDEEVSESLKYDILKRAMRDLTSKGRLVLSCEYASVRIARMRCYESAFLFETVYIGRKAVNKKGIRHTMRSSMRKMKDRPVVVKLM